MCIGVWTLEHPQYALILCTNRDEFLDRPTQNAHFHNFGEKTEDHPADILSGLDMRAGGTWLGIGRNGKVALLTNITEEAVNFGTSRGSLVSSFLLSDPALPLEEETARMIAQDGKYSGFNLMLFAPRLKSDGSLTYETVLVTNHGAGGVLNSRPLSADERCCGGISNGIDGAGASNWPKIKRVTQDFDAVLQSFPPSPSEDELVDRLMEVLA
ncbi:NRDE domain containing protein [Amanita muscaria]